ncbi:nucleotide sugar dehydrogenase [Mucisphaera sp.]|uniref:nucleotide sugar dehydrogenase n=1 Tax=Mucisphaera sp. TaxID=2913024 RepID=UPI003D121071
MAEPDSNPPTQHATVGVIALGYVGLPLAQLLAQAGHRVVGYDTDPEKIHTIAAGRSPLRHIPGQPIADCLASGRFLPTSNLDDLRNADTIIICVPTPLGAHQEPDLTYVRDASHIAARQLKPGGLLILESTTYPGTTRDLIGKILSEHGRTPGHDTYLAYSPEREDPGRTDHALRSVPKLVGGIDDASTNKAADLYRTAFDNVIPVASAEVAEAAKLLENIYRAVNIALVNEMKIVLSEIGVDIWQVIEAASTKPFGFQPFYPGPGLGGHCIPVDPFYLAWRAKEANLTTRFIELAGEINRDMPRYVVERTVLALNDAGIATRNANILILGLAYKPNVDDVRESPSYELIRRYRALAANVTYNDPHLPVAPNANGFDPKLTSTDLTDEALTQADAVVIACHHDAYDWHQIAQKASLVVDTRGVMRKQVNPAAKIVEA